jgi:hypothetical protein
MQRKTLNMYCSRDDTLSQTHCVKKYYQSKIIKDCDKLTNPEEIKKIELVIGSICNCLRILDYYES